jgi:hypothetical protein
LFSTLAGKLISTIFSTSRVNFKILTAYSLIVFSLPSYGYTISLIDGVSPSDTQALSIIQKYLDAYASSNSTILTNEIALFFIDQKVINMYNLPELFRYKTLNILFEILKHHNIDYVLINITIDSNTFERISNDLTILANKGVIRKLIELHPYTLYEVQNNE